LYLLFAAAGNILLRGSNERITNAKPPVLNDLSHHSGLTTPALVHESCDKVIAAVSCPVLVQLQYHRQLAAVGSGEQQILPLDA